MAHIHKKMKKGRPYYYVRETARVNGKSKVVNQIYLGSPERIAQLASGAKVAECTKLTVEEYGALWLANLMDNHVEIAPIVDSVIKKVKRKRGLRLESISYMPP
jgi:hypothetical protein